MLNLLLFVPCSWMLSLSVLYLQRLGRISPLDRWLGLGVWIGVVSLLVGAVATDGQSLLSDTSERHWAEVVASCLFLAMQCFYAWRIGTNLKPMHVALQDYYDNDMVDTLRWMQLSVLVLAAMGLLVPLLIFFDGLLLPFFGVFVLVGLFYLVDSFSYYVVSSSMMKVHEAEQNAEEEQQEQQKEEQLLESSPKTISDEQMQRVANAVERWVTKGGYLRQGVNCPTAADEMHIPRYQLSAWLRSQGIKYTYWLADLRVEEAKRVLVLHSDWSHETVSKHCGFSDRSYFQTVFKKHTGITPAEFVDSQKKS